jgi:predicted esterase
MYHASKQVDKSPVSFLLTRSVSEETALARLACCPSLTRRVSICIKCPKTFGCLFRSARFWCYVGAMALCSALTGSTWAAEARVDKALAAKFLIADSFEEGDKAPKEWHQGTDVPAVTYEWDKGVASHGKRSLSLRKRANRYFPIAEWSRVVPHQGIATAVQVRVKVKAVRAAKATVDVAFLDAQDQLLKHEWAAYIGEKEEGDKPATHDWKEYQGTVAIPEGTVKFAIGLQMYGPGSVWFDELLIRYIEDGAPLEPAVEPVADEAAPTPIKVAVGKGEGEYLLVPPAEASGTPTGLLIVLPGGDGSADFHPFVRSIHRESLGGRLAVAQLIAPKFTPEQQITWPTHENPVAEMTFTTEDLAGKVIEDIAAKLKIDRERVYLLGWSSGGPACYATILQKESPAAGAFVAMSVFQPKNLPELNNAAKRRFYILHSPEDQVCPYRMAVDAGDRLQEAGAEVELAEYAGGHGWQGDLFGTIRRGVEWLVRAKN